MKGIRDYVESKKSPLKRPRNDHVKNVFKELEDKWYIPPVPSKGLPEYDVDKDKYCPRSLVKSYNKRTEIKEKQFYDINNGNGGNHNHNHNDSNNDNNNNTNTNKDPSSSSSSSLYNKEVNVQGEFEMSVTPDDVPKPIEHFDVYDIQQRISIRENLLSELQKLIVNQQDISCSMSEVVDFIKAIRYQTLDIIEIVEQWQRQHRQYPSKIRAFIYHGSNYLVKMISDLDFLDNYDEIVERFCFEFSGNPLAYRDGGDLRFTSEFQLKMIETSSIPVYDTYLIEDTFIDGIELKRIREAEKILIQELSRHQKIPLYSIAPDTINNISSVGNDDNSNTISNLDDCREGGQERFSQIQVGFQDSVDIGGSTYQLPSPYRDGKDRNKSDRQFSQMRRSIKKGSKNKRLKALLSEVEVLQAIKVDLEDQSRSYKKDYNDLSFKMKRMEFKSNEAMRLGRDSAAHVLTVELGLLASEAEEIQQQIKKFHREIFQVSLEERRKRLIMKQIEDEISSQKKQKSLQKKFSKFVREKGLDEAIRYFASLAPLSPLKNSTKHSNANLYSPRSYQTILTFQRDLLFNPKSNKLPSIKSTSESIIHNSFSNDSNNNSNSLPIVSISTLKSQPLSSSSISSSAFVILDTQRNNEKCISLFVDTNSSVPVDDKDSKDIRNVENTVIIPSQSVSCKNFSSDDGEVASIEESHESNRYQNEKSVDGYSTHANTDNNNNDDDDGDQNAENVEELTFEELIARCKALQINISYETRIEHEDSEIKPSDYEKERKNSEWNDQNSNFNHDNTDLIDTDKVMESNSMNMDLDKKLSSFLSETNETTIHDTNSINTIDEIKELSVMERIVMNNPNESNILTTSGEGQNYHNYDQITMDYRFHILDAIENNWAPGDDKIEVKDENKKDSDDVSKTHDTNEINSKIMNQPILIESILNNQNDLNQFPNIDFTCHDHNDDDDDNNNDLSSYSSILTANREDNESTESFKSLHSEKLVYDNSDSTKPFSEVDISDNCIKDNHINMNANMNHENSNSNSSNNNDNIIVRDMISVESPISSSAVSHRTIDRLILSNQDSNLNNGDFETNIIKDENTIDNNENDQIVSSILSHLNIENDSSVPYDNSSNIMLNVSQNKNKHESKNPKVVDVNRITETSDGFIEIPHDSSSLYDNTTTKDESTTYISHDSHSIGIDSPILTTGRRSSYNSPKVTFESSLETSYHNGSMDESSMDSDTMSRNSEFSYNTYASYSTANTNLSPLGVVRSSRHQHNLSSQVSESTIGTDGSVSRQTSITNNPSIESTKSTASVQQSRLNRKVDSHSVNRRTMPIGMTSISSSSSTSVASYGQNFRMDSSSSFDTLESNRTNYKKRKEVGMKLVSSRQRIEHDSNRKDSNFSLQTIGSQRSMQSIGNSTQTSIGVGRRSYDNGESDNDTDADNHSTSFTVVPAGAAGYKKNRTRKI